MKLYKPEEIADKKPEGLVDVYEIDGNIVIKLVSPIGDWLANVGVINSTGFHATVGCKQVIDNKSYSVPFECDSRGAIKCHQGE